MTRSEKDVRWRTLNIDLRKMRLRWFKSCKRRDENSIFRITESIR